jgi:hypothetical protein
MNNAAIAAYYAIKSHGIKRVAVIDWDVHHGNGTQALTYGRDDVSTSLGLCGTGSLLTSINSFYVRSTNRNAVFMSNRWSKFICVDNGPMQR